MSHQSLPWDAYSHFRLSSQALSLHARQCFNNHFGIPARPFSFQKTALTSSLTRLRHSAARLILLFSLSAFSHLSAQANIAVDPLVTRYGTTNGHEQYPRALERTTAISLGPVEDHYRQPSLLSPNSSSMVILCEQLLLLPINSLFAYRPSHALLFVVLW